MSIDEVIKKVNNKYCVYSHTSGRKFGCYDSRKDAEERIKQMKTFGEELSIEEVSAAGSGNVQGFSVRKRKREFKEDIQYHDRAAFLEELTLREHIKNAIYEINEAKTAQVKTEENLIRKLIKTIIREAQRDTDDVPHRSTGINMLEELLKKIIPILEDAYKALTTNERQRKSFRAHILNAVQHTLIQADIVNQAVVKSLEEEINNEDLTVDIGNEELEGSNEKFIDIDSDEAEAPEEDTFGIPGEDETGRNLAEITYDKIEKNVLDSYNVLGDNEDKVLFYDYLLTNLKLYFDKFEDELSVDGAEPAVDALKNEK